MTPQELQIYRTFCETSWFCQWTSRWTEILQNDQKSQEIIRTWLLPLSSCANVSQNLSPLCLHSFTYKMKTTGPTSQNSSYCAFQRKTWRVLVCAPELPRCDSKDCTAPPYIVQWATYSVAPGDPAECSKLFNNRKVRLLYSNKEN